jgi:AcrR family transcriptional regulator
MASPRVQSPVAGTSSGTKKAPAGTLSSAKAATNKAATNKVVPSNAVPSTAVPSKAPEPTAENANALGGPASKRVLRSQGRRTMRRLLDAAMVAFDQRGYYDTRINDVVEIAKTSHGTFYLYFSNKEDLLRALVTEAGTHAKDLATALNRPPEDGGTPQLTDVRGWIAAYSDLWIRYAPLFRAWTDLATIDPALLDILRQNFTLMSDALERQIETHASDRSIDPQTAGMAVLAMLDRFHYMTEFLGQPVGGVALDTLATMVHRSLFDPSLVGSALPD